MVFFTYEQVIQFIKMFGVKNNSLQFQICVQKFGVQNLKLQKWLKLKKKPTLKI